MYEDVEVIRKKLLSIKPSYQNTNRTEIRVRCPFCGDSVKNKMDAHFYISMKPPFLYHCFKCEENGFLTGKVLRSLEIYDSDVQLAVAKANKEIKECQGIKKISYSKVNLNNIPFNTPAAQNAVEYFNRRYNLKFDEEYIVNKFKVVTDAAEFFKLNKINGVSLANFDYYNSIGFISSDKSHIVFRDITGNQKVRYNNLALIPEMEDTSKVYNISTKVDLMSTSVDLIITEGIFDIIGVYSHFYKDNDENKIFAAACGKSYMTVIEKYIRMGFLNLNIIIYSDADVDISFYKNMKYRSDFLKNSRITIYYNNLYDPVTKYGKDYGVPKEGIQLRKYII